MYLQVSEESSMINKDKTMDKIVSLCKNRGFIYPGSDIYGGLSNSWDYGPLGALLKENVKTAWIKKFVQECKYNVKLDCAILMNPKVWKTSGHLSSFSDPLLDCKDCKTRHRADELLENNDIKANGMDHIQMEKCIKENNISCPNCGSSNFTDIRNFNLMFKTFQGVTENSKNEVYLRPETAQGIFVNFANIQRTTRKKVPFGVCQIGKAFRNEITPGNFIFRTREFEQMELEFFCKPGTDIEWFEYWKNYCENWLIQLGIDKSNLRIRDHSKEELCFYSNATSDIEFLFPFGWGELWGIADRTDYDLNQHMKASGKSLEYFDPCDNSRYVPYVIEPSLGADRMTLAFLCNAYDEEYINQNDMRTVLHLHPALSPYKAAILPLSKKLSEKAYKLFDILSGDFMLDFDDIGSIGKRYRRHDEIGTPFCLTYDFDSEQDNCITIRDRDSMQQERISIDKLSLYLRENLNF